MENQISTIPATSTIPVVDNQQMVTPEKPKKSNFLTILLSILLFVSITIIGFLIFQTQKLTKELTELKTVGTSTPTPVVQIEPTITPNTTPEPNINTKMYTSDKYGFSFRYPNNTKILGDTTNTTFTLIDQNKAITVIIGYNSDKYPTKDYFLRQIDPQDPQSISKYVSFVNLNIKNNNFVWASQDPVYFKLQSTGLSNYLITTNKNYVINFNTSDFTSNEPQESLINQILSTFKLTD